MVGDNDAGAFSTYGQAGQNYGTRLLWTLLLLVPVLYVNQEMVLRLGAVTGVGHARLILERFGKFWGAFSVIDLFILNALTIVTEFIGITLAAGYLGVPKLLAVVLAAAVIIAAAFTGSFRRFERIAMTFCAGSLLLIPLVLLTHPHVGQMAHGFAVPGLPGGSGQMATVMLLIIGIVGTTVAPWQLFFQQSYVIDKRITPRFMSYEKADLWIGIVIVVIGAAAADRRDRRRVRRDQGGGQLHRRRRARPRHRGLRGPRRGRGVRDRAARRLHHRRVRGLAVHRLRDRGRARPQALAAPRVPQAKGFYAIYAALIAVAAAIVLIPGTPLGLLTEGVQALAGVLLPSATVFLLLLCNDRAVLGPWVNGRKTTMFAAAVVALLVALSVVLTASVLFPNITARQIIEIICVCGAAAAVRGAWALTRARRSAAASRSTAPAGRLAHAAAGGAVQAGHVEGPRSA